MKGDEVKLQDFLLRLEAGVKKLAGKKRAAEVVAEMRAHIEESAQELIARGLGPDEAYDKALEGLGAVESREFVPTDGAPRWFDRLVRTRCAFWSAFALTSISVWLASVQGPELGPWMVWAVIYVSLVVFAVLGAFAARWTIWSAIKALAIGFVVNTLFMATFYVDVTGRYGFPYLRLRSVVESDVMADHAKWSAIGSPGQLELEQLQHVSRFYRQENPDPFKLSKAGHGPQGLYRYPASDHRSWSEESGDFAFVVSRWKQDRGATADFYNDTINAHAKAFNKWQPALELTPVDNLGAAARGNVFFAVLFAIWFTMCALVGDILRCTVVVAIAGFRRLHSKR